MAKPPYQKRKPGDDRFRIQLSRDNAKTWENCHQSFADGKVAMLCVQYYQRSSPQFTWRYIDTLTNTPAGVVSLKT